MGIASMEACADLLMAKRSCARPIISSDAVCSTINRMERFLFFRFSVAIAGILDSFWYVGCERHNVKRRNGNSVLSWVLAFLLLCASALSRSVVAFSEAILLVVFLCELSQGAAISRFCGYANIALSTVIIVGDLVASFVSWKVISLIGTPL